VSEFKVEGGEDLKVTKLSTIIHRDKAEELGISTLTDARNSFKNNQCHLIRGAKNLIRAEKNCGLPFEISPPDSHQNWMFSIDYMAYLLCG